MVMALNSFGQVIKIHAGISASTFSWKPSPPVNYKHSQASISNKFVFLGVDYNNRKYFNLSSGIGIVSRSNESLVHLATGGNATTIQPALTILNYLSLNTTLDLKYPTRFGLVPFFSFGPRVDFLRSNESNVFSYFRDSSNLYQVMYGLTFGPGIKYEIANFQIGIRYDLLVNFHEFSELTFGGSNESCKLSGHTQLYGLTLGYKLR